MSVEEALAQYAHSFPTASISDQAMRTARQSVLDILGVTLAGQTRPEVRLLQKAMKTWGPPECPVLGTAIQLPPADAALLNGAAARVLDFDDVVDPLGIHPSVAIFPVICAIAALSPDKVSGRDFLAAMAIGQDLHTRLARSRKETLLESGRYDLSKVIAAAAAAARLRGLSQEQLHAAMGIAYTSALGEAQCMVEGAPTVSYQQGLVASNAVRAVLLAEQGFTGARQFLTGRYGLFSAFEPGSRPETLLDRLGQHFAGDDDIAYKPYPTCRPNISATALAIELADGRPISADDVERIDIAMNQQIFDLVCAPEDQKWRPRTPVEARFGMAYTVAVGLQNGIVFIQDYDEDALSQPEILQLSEKVHPRVDPACEIAELGAHGLIIVNITWADGTRTIGEVAKPKGNPQNPLSQEELEDKFSRCLAYAFPGIEGSQIDRLIQASHSLSDPNFMVRDFLALIATLDAEDTDLTEDLPQAQDLVPAQSED